MEGLRILSGQYKGTKLLSPGLETTHPMGSREKLALFNILSPYLAGANVLDYFAGSGALGLEALSRGARHVTFVENNPKALKVIRENCNRCGLGADRWQAIRHFPNNDEISQPSNCNFNKGDSIRGTPSDLAQAKRGEDALGDKSRQDPMLKLQCQNYDIIISDPPYDNYQTINYAELLAPGGILALSHPKEFDLASIKNLTLLKTSHYAACHISLFTK